VVRPAIAIGVDVGGSGIKVAAVDVIAGRLISERLQVPTPEPSTPEASIAAIARLVEKAVAAAGTEADTAPAGVGIPSVVIEGFTRSAANIDPAWIDYPARPELERALGRRVVVVNDADAAGVAKARFGAAAGKKGTVLVLTLGTGVGSAIFVDGRLVPNTELGHMEIRGMDAERRSAAVARVRQRESWRAWAADLDEHLHAMYRLFSPGLFVIGGGVSKDADRFIPRLTVPAPVIPAALRNDAGIIGAAVLASERGLRG